MSKCFGICRVSTESQSNNTSLEHQKESIMKYSEYHNLELIDVFEEVYTGTTQDRDSLNMIKDLVNRDECNTIIIYSIDRLMRSFSEGVIFIKYLLDNDVKIISTTEDINTDTITGKFFVNMILSLSELERNTIVDRLEIGRLNKFKNQLRSSGRICFGYKKNENGDVVVNDEESKIVKYIFKKYSQLKRLNITKTKQTQRVLRLLKSRNFKYKEREFQSYHLRHILQNKFYIGQISHGVQTNKHSYESIISRRLFNLCVN